MSVNADQVRHVARLARLALGDDEIDKMVLTGRYLDGPIGTLDYTLHNGQWITAPPKDDAHLYADTDLATANVEIRTVERKKLFINGKPVGGDME